MNFKYVDKEGNTVEMNDEIRINLDEALTKIKVKSINAKRIVFRFLLKLLVTVIVTLAIICLLCASAVTLVSNVKEPAVETASVVTELDIPEEPPVEESAEPEIAPIKYFRPAALEEELFAVVVSECEANNLPVNVALAVMKTETQGFDANGTNYNSNGTYDSGVMQINSTNFAGFAKRYNCPEFVNNPQDPVNNITVGIRHLAELYNSYYESYQDEIKSMLAAAGAYNRGASNQNKYKNIYEYNARVYAHYQNLSAGLDININYAQEIPQIKTWLVNNVQL